MEKRRKRAKTQEEMQRLARIYDVKRTNRFNKEYVHFFESIYRNYARLLSNSLFVRFRIPMKLRLAEMSQVSYLEYVMDLPKDSVTTVYTLFPLKGPFCMTFDRCFSFLAVDSLLGGSFINEAPERREFTDVEKGIIRMAANAFVSPQDQCYSEYGRVDSAIRSIEFNPVLMQICSDDESVLVLDFVLEANEKEFPIKIAIPYGSIENLSEVLQIVRHQEDLLDAPTEESREKLDYHLKQARVESSVILGETKLTLHQLENLKEGQLIKLDRQVGAFLDFKVEDQVRFKVQPGVSGQKMAVQITEILNQPIR